MTLDDIPALLAYADEGNFRERDVFSDLARMTAREEVEAVVRRLPERWQAAFISWLFDAFDNNTPPDKFLMIDSSVGDVPEKRLIVERIRAWIANNRPPAAPTPQSPPLNDNDRATLEKMRANRDKRMQRYEVSGRANPLPSDSLIFEVGVRAVPW